MKNTIWSMTKRIDELNAVLDVQDCIINELREALEKANEAIDNKTVLHSEIQEILERTI